MAPPDSLLSSLNPEQRLAAAHVEGPLLILAGAGSGKTRVITHRIAHLVREERVAPSEIFAVTFTNKAAQEMRERVEDLLGPPARWVWLTTFHSAGVRLLREFGHHVGIPSNLVIYDDRDQLTLVKRLLKEGGPELDPRGALSFIDRAKGEGLGPDEVEVAEYDLHAQAQRALYGRYQAALRRSGAVDFGDLLVEPVRLLREVPQVRAELHRRLRFVMVDEFQDTSLIQFELLRLLTGDDGNLVVVGDDDQSIYQWRGADLRNLLGFERYYPSAKVVRLERNYRSTQVILDAAWSVVRHNRDRREKKLWTDQEGGAPIELYQALDEQGEARLVAARVAAACQRYSPREIAVLYRTNAQSRAIEDALRSGRVPYQIVRGRSFYDRAEIKDIVAYLRLAVNPASDADAERVVNTPRRGIGARTVEAWRAAAVAAGVPLVERAQGEGPIEGLKDKARGRLAQFATFIGQLNGLVEAERPPHEIVEEAITGSGYRAALIAEGSDEALDRLGNLNELVNAAAQRADAGLGLIELLDEMALTADADGREPEAERVSLMTLHAAKGLEFEVVCVTGLEEKVFPHARAFDSYGGEDQDSLAEERRLCYVGLTRARSELSLFHASSRFLNGQRQSNRPSRFLGDLPPELLAVQAPPAPRWGGSRWGAASPGGSGRGRSAWDGDGWERDPPSPGGRGWSGPSQVKELDLDPGDLEVVEYDFDQRPPEERAGGGPAPGLWVQHRSFGRGQIQEVNGAGPSARLVVRFEQVGVKRLVAKYVELL